MWLRTICAISVCFSSWAQIGGQRSLEFLNIPTNARTAALGGVNVSLYDQDVNMFISNPALLNAEMSDHFSINYQAYLADINNSTLFYAKNIEKYGLWGFGLRYFDYGDFEGYDATGAPTGEFDASEFAFMISHSHSIGNFGMGGTLKLAHSSIASFGATALMLDLGGTFIHPTRDWTLGLVIKNFGILISDYSDQSDSVLPFDVQLGTSFKPEHMPIRFSFTVYNLHQADIAFFDPTGDGEPGKEEPGTVDKIFRHINFGMEVILHKNFNLRGGYNHLLRKELRIQQNSGGAGFSFGFMFRIKAFEFAYTRNLYHPAGGTNYFTLTSNLGALFKKKQINQEQDI